MHNHYQYTSSKTRLSLLLCILQVSYALNVVGSLSSWVNCCMINKYNSSGQAICSNSTTDPANIGADLPRGTYLLSVCLNMQNCYAFAYNTEDCMIGTTYVPDCLAHVGTTVTNASLTALRKINLALNRPAYQSSTFATYTADKAVDGNYDTNTEHFHCAHNFDSPGGPNWIAVDLGQQFDVDHIVVENREAYPNRLDYFIVGVTNISPLVSAPVRGQYPLCGQYPATSAPKANMTVTCFAATPPGRYVIVQQPVTGIGCITICEMEVYSRSHCGNY